MKFCPVCKNILFGIDEDVVDEKRTAVLACRKCEYKEPITNENPIVYEHVLKEDKSGRLVMNPYLKYDPTLQHLTNITCPNEECVSRQTKESDVVAIKVDPVNLVWMYQCVKCDVTWKQSSQAV